MDNWLKWAIPLAAGAGLLATGGAATPLLGMMGGAEGAAAGGAAAEAATGATAIGGLGGLGGVSATAEGAALAGAAPEAAGALSYVTPSILSGAPLPTTELLGEMYGGATAGPAVPSAFQTAMGYAGKAGKAYSAGNAAMSAGQPPPMQAPAPHPIFQGEAPRISQQQEQPHHSGNQFAQMLLEQRRRGMLG